MQTFLGNRFTWTGSHGVSFASDLGIQQWPCGFYIRSHKTGQQVLFLPKKDLFHGQGEDREFAGREFFSPGGGITVTVFND